LASAALVPNLSHKFSTMFEITGFSGDSTSRQASLKIT